MLERGARGEKHDRNLSKFGRDPGPIVIRSDSEFGRTAIGFRLDCGRNSAAATCAKQSSGARAQGAWVLVLGWGARARVLERRNTSDG